MRTKLAILFFILWFTGSASAATRSDAPWHPLVFNMIESWVSDIENPVVTEVNLDAVQRNRNQFDQDEVKKEGEWVVCRAQDGGFKRYRVIERKDNYYKVEYQDNGGGTLTTSAQIGFALEKREIVVDRRPKVINILRVISYSK